MLDRRTPIAPAEQRTNQMESSRARRRKSNRNGAANPPASKVDLEQLSVFELSTPPENDQLYGRIRHDDPEVQALSKSIRQRGILEPLVISLDNYVISGNRRLVAATEAGQHLVPVRRVNVRRSDDLDEFTRLLREHNRHRDKSIDQKIHEELVDVSAADAHQALREYRRSKRVVDAKMLEIGDVRFRKEISDAKLPLLRAIQRIVEEQRAYWPLTPRRNHYTLLNDPPLIHASKPESIYCNNLKSYRANVDITARARLAGLIPFEAIDDETRPVTTWDVHKDLRAFLRREFDSSFRGFYRDLQQSQPHHIELVLEKNTVRSIGEPVAGEFAIPCTVGRGYCSLPPRYAMAERFKASGKNKLILLVVSDFDPEGENIAESFARSMRDDFGIYLLDAIKVAITADQVEEHQLPPMLQAKASSPRAKKFIEKNGSNVYELEALPPDALQAIIREAIQSVIDQEVFAAEVESEAQDALDLQAVRRKLMNGLKGIELG
jgi:hypothetical protein